MANVDEARTYIQQTQRLLAERYNEQLYRFESPINDLLKKALRALDEEDAPMARDPQEQSEETRVAPPEEERRPDWPVPGPSKTTETEPETRTVDPESESKTDTEPEPEPEEPKGKRRPQQGSRRASPEPRKAKE